MKTGGKAVYFSRFEFQCDPSEELTALDLAGNGKNVAKMTLLIQSLFVIILGSVFFFIYDPSSAISVVTGGTLSVVSNAVFAFYVFRFSGASKNHEIVNSMKKGNKMKLLITLPGLAVVFQTPLFNPVDVIIGYCLLLLMQYPISLLVHRLKQEGAVQKTDF